MTSASDPTPEDFARMGIDEDLIRKFVEHFYANMHKDETIGHFFNEQMETNWDDHIEKMCNFWSAILLGTKRFNGRPMPAHIKLKGLEQDHFLHWLKNFEKTIKFTCPPQSVPHIMKKAHMIANSLQYGVFYRPEVMKQKFDLKDNP